MKVRGFITHKKAEAYVDCQDFFAVNSSKKSVAISDGMAQSIFPQWWAEELVTAWNENDWQPNNTDECLSQLRNAWLKRVQNFLESEKGKGKNPYRLENNLIDKIGAGATLCAIKFVGHQWTGYVLGDSCLISVNADNSISDILRSNEGDFGNHPDFFDSMIGGKGAVKHVEGELLPQCKLLLVSDPFAEFLYEKQKTNQEREFIQQLLDIQSHEDFVALVERWREDERLHNDDSTLVVIEYDNSPEFILEHIDSLEQLCNEEVSKESPIVAPQTAPLPNEIEEHKASISKNNLPEGPYLLLKDIKSLLAKIRKFPFKFQKANKNIPREINSFIQKIDTILNQNNDTNK